MTMDNQECYICKICQNRKTATLSKSKAIYIQVSHNFQNLENNGELYTLSLDLLCNFNLCVGEKKKPLYRGKRNIFILKYKPIKARICI